jgi:ATP-dependent Clp protease protease subunit
MSTTNEIFLYDDIGPDWAGLVSGKYVINELAKYKGEPVTVRINSPGGWITEGQAIYNALRRHSETQGKVTVEIDALAASAASFIAMAGDTIRIAENAFTMIHFGWTYAAGNAEELREVAGVLDKLDNVITNIYTARTKQEEAKVREMMAAETWMDAKESVACGFADEIGTALNTQANIKAGRYAKAPERILTAQLPREEKRDANIARISQQLKLNRARLGV